MALSSKDRLIKIIEALPDDAPFDDMIHDLVKRHGMGDFPGIDFDAARRTDADLEPEVTSTKPVTFHPERRGRFTVLVPDRPVPPITVEMVNVVIDQIRREPEDRWLGLTDD
jgi:hypothetical protein